MALLIPLPTVAATRHWGRLLARCVTAYGVTALLQRGPLGSGKTLLTNALVEALPGGDMAEPASPSFTLCHRYPTSPPVLHCDLYRCPGNPPEELLDALDDARTLLVVEWAEYLPKADFPQDYLDIAWQTYGEQRQLTLRAYGNVATAMVPVLRNATAQIPTRCSLPSQTENSP